MGLKVVGLAEIGDGVVGDALDGCRAGLTVGEAKVGRFDGSVVGLLNVGEGVVGDALDGCLAVGEDDVGRFDGREVGLPSVGDEDAALKELGEVEVG